MNMGVPLSIIEPILFGLGVIVEFVVFVFVAAAAKSAYDWFRTKINKPRIGFEYFLCKMLKRGDHVSINGKVMRFNHFAQNGETIDIIAPPSNGNRLSGGELAFQGRGLGYVFYELSALMNCEFIYGKYGLKWAASEYWASVAEEKVKESRYN